MLADHNQDQDAIFARCSAVRIFVQYEIGVAEQDTDINVFAPDDESTLFRVHSRSGISCVSGSWPCS